MTDEAGLSIEQMIALPAGTVVISRSSGVVAKRASTAEYPHAVDDFWEVVGSELGTDAESLVTEHDDLLVIYSPAL